MGTLGSEWWTEQEMYDAYRFFAWMESGVMPVQVVDDFIDWRRRFE